VSPQVKSLSPAEIIDLLGLESLPGEGGFFVQTYLCPETIPRAGLPARYSSARPFGSAILYLLTPETWSALHRLPSDEIFHFHLGDPVTMLQLGPDGQSQTVTLGPDLRSGHQVQVVVPRGTWQGSALEPGGQWALLGATVAPGFDWSDLEFPDIEELVGLFPDRRDLILRLGRLQ